jgi:thioredoxin 1
MTKKVELIDFYADWCGPCKMMTPTIESLINEYNGDESEVDIKKCNVDQDADSASKFGVRSIPTLVFLKDGEEAGRLVGVQSKDVLVNKINELLSA